MIHDSNGNLIYQIIGGTGGGKLKRWPGNYKENDRVKCEFHNEEYHGYILVTIDGVKATVQWRAMVDISGSGWKVLDSFTYTAGNVKVH